MGKKVNRIKINRLSSQNNFFDEIIFHDGVNLILGEKYDNSTVRGRKTNGVGKSMCIEFLDFCLLSEYKKSRIYKIPAEVFPLDEEVILELEIGDNAVTIKRNRKHADKPVIIRDEKATSFKKLSDAKDYLTELIFSQLDGKEVPSMRNLFSLLMRDERSEFKDILMTHDASARIPADLRTHLYMLGFSLEGYSRILETIGEIDKVTTTGKKIEKELTVNGAKKVADVKAEFNALEAELLQLEETIEVFKTNDTFNSMENELLELEGMLDQLRQKQKAVKRESDKIKKLPKPEYIDDTEIEMVYNQFKDNLGDVVVKSLNEILGFKNKVEEFQRVLINQKAKELDKQLRDISGQIRFLDDEYSEKIRLIDQKGILKNLKASLKIYEAKKEAGAHTKFLFDQYEQYEKQKKLLKLQKSQETLDIDNEIEDSKELLKAFNSSISDIHMAVMENKECSFDIRTSNKKNPISITLRIFDDGSHSVDRTKVFIYDMALLFNEATRLNHPLFLVHDNIFDVDQDTLVQCLNYVYKQEERFSDFQYILTLNRDKIENEEKRKLILMDIDEHVVASFTKKKKFLKRDYQEK